MPKITEAQREASKRYRDKNREQLRKKWREYRAKKWAADPEKVRAVNRKSYRNHAERRRKDASAVLKARRLTPEGRACRMINTARHSESKRGVPDHLRLPMAGTEAYNRLRRKIAKQIREGFHGYMYDLSDTTVRGPWIPSLSRKNHNNPRYTRNWCLEPWALNCMRLNWSDDVLRSLSPYLSEKPGWRP